MRLHSVGEGFIVLMSFSERPVTQKVSESLTPSVNPELGYQSLQLPHPWQYLNVPSLSLACPVFWELFSGFSISPLLFFVQAKYNSILLRHIPTQILVPSFWRGPPSLGWPWTQKWSFSLALLNAGMTGGRNCQPLPLLKSPSSTEALFTLSDHRGRQPRGQIIFFEWPVSSEILHI